MHAAMAFLTVGQTDANDIDRLFQVEVPDIYFMCASVEFVRSAWSSMLRLKLIHLIKGAPGDTDMRP